MASESIAGMKVSVWRPFTPDRLLALQNPEAETLTIMSSDMRLQQEAFTWQVREDIWGGVVDAALRQTLSERFITEFEPILPPDQRGLDKLRKLLDDLSAAIPDTEWSESGYDMEADGKTPFRLNALLAFYDQMLWIYEVFKDAPGASVSVR